MEALYIGWAAFAVLTAVVERSRGLVPTSEWVIIGFVLGPFGLLWSLLKKPA